MRGWGTEEAAAAAGAGRETARRWVVAAGGVKGKGRWRGRGGFWRGGSGRRSRSGWRRGWRTAIAARLGPGRARRRCAGRWPGTGLGIYRAHLAERRRWRGRGGRAGEAGGACGAAGVGGGQADDGLVAGADQRQAGHRVPGQAGDAGVGGDDLSVAVCAGRGRCGGSWRRGCGPGGNCAGRAAPRAAAAGAPAGHGAYQRAAGRGGGPGGAGALGRRPDRGPGRRVADRHAGGAHDPATMLVPLPAGRTAGAFASR